MRKSIDYTVPGVRTDTLGSRDNGKTFRLTEMPADQAERWAIRLLLAAGRGGLEVPDDVMAGGMAGVAAVGFAALFRIPWADAAPLLDEMMACVLYVPEAAGAPAMRILDGAASQIEETKTRVILRAKLFELHTGFSLPGVQ